MSLSRTSWSLLKQLSCLLFIAAVSCLSVAQSRSRLDQLDFDHAQNVGTTYVPLDSWVYPVFDRLAALGLVESDSSGLRPWTRRECARLLEEAIEHTDSSGEPNRRIRSFVQLGLDRLAEEFAPERSRVFPHLKLQSIYSRITAVEGDPLNSGYYFGQTVANDFGRQHRAGVNIITGLEARGAYRLFSAFLSGEYRHSGSAEPFPLSARQAIANIDQIPLPSASRLDLLNQLRVLDSYAGLSTENWMVTVGKQSLRWGFGQAGSLSFSQNAEPVLMIRLNRTSPLKLPSLLRLMGPVRTEIFVAKLEGHQHIFDEGRLFSAPLRQPLLHGGRLAFKPTPNLELGFGVSTIFAGEGTPLTLHTFFRSLSLGNTIPGQESDPGDRRSSFDFKYRLPFLRDWVTLYSDSMTEDEFSPIAYPRKSAFAPGIYMPRLPGLPSVEFRAEGFYTDLPNDPRVGVFFSNFRYRDGLSNRGEILGHPVGRQGHGFQTDLRYWFRPKTDVRVSFGDWNTSSRFLAGGSRRQQLAMQANHAIGLATIDSDLYLTLVLRSETWRAPLLAPSQQGSFSTSLALRLVPRK